jgi:hypothetical protein
MPVAKQISFGVHVKLTKNATASEFEIPSFKNPKITSS